MKQILADDPLEVSLPSNHLGMHLLYIVLGYKEDSLENKEYNSKSTKIVEDSTEGASPRLFPPF